MTLNEQLEALLYKFDENREKISEKNKSIFVDIAKMDLSDESISFIPAEYGRFFSPFKPGHMFESVKKRVDQDFPSILRILDKIQQFLYCSQLQEVTAEKVNEVSPYWNNGYFGGADARCAYAMAAALRPKRIVEIGIGNSTKFFRKSIDDFNLPTKLTAIDPSPRADVRGIVDEIIIDGIHTAPISFFESLEPGDFLFLDGAHQAINGSDVPKFFLEILPFVRKGVIIQVHDITLPYQHTDPFHNRYFSEIYVMAASFLYTKDIEVLMPVHYLHKIGLLADDGASFWFQKK